MEPFLGVGRRILVTTHFRLGVLHIVALTALVAGCSGAPEPRDAGQAASEAAPGAASAQCVLSLAYDGARFESAAGPPDRSPVLTGRTSTASMAGCDDGSGDGAGPEDVQVHEIEGVPVETAFWYQDSIMLREGAASPDSLDALYRAPICEFAGRVEVQGQWLGVSTSKKARFDGDLRTPLRIDLHVEEVSDNAADLDRYTIRVHDDGTARPALDKTMAEAALWSSRAALKTVLVCADGKFHATSFGIVPR